MKHPGAYSLAAFTTALLLTQGCANDQTHAKPQANGVSASSAASRPAPQPSGVSAPSPRWSPLSRPDGSIDWSGWQPPSIAASSCHYRKAKKGKSLPDPTCTPGLADPTVTDNNAKQTICRPGWIRAHQPPQNISDKLKRIVAAAYGASEDGELDRLIPTDLGGDSVDPRNLWLQVGEPSPNPKDRVESALHDLVCTGKVPLHVAQQRIAANWTTALRGY